MNNRINMGFSGKETEENLKMAAKNEAESFLNYKIFSENAKNGNFMEISELLDKFADNEREHAELWLSYLGNIGVTSENIDKAITGEENAVNFYDKASKTAYNEGFTEIGDKFALAKKIEENHRETLKNISDKITNDTLYSSTADSLWQCLNCGYSARGNKAPDVCPLCGYPVGYFKKA